MTNEKQEQFERENQTMKGLVGKLVRAINPFNTPKSISSLEEGSNRAPEIVSIKAPEVSIYNPPERTEETERTLQRLFEETPLYQILEEQERAEEDLKVRMAQNGWQHRLDSVADFMQFADLIRIDEFKEALKKIDGPIKRSVFEYPKGRKYIGNDISVSNFIGTYYGSFYELNSNVSRVGSIKVADASIVAGRLARKVDEDPKKYYSIASIALNDASTNLGGIMFHIGARRLGEILVADMEKTSQEIDRRYKIVGRELGRS
jgi:hypothetical protein